MITNYSDAKDNGWLRWTAEGLYGAELLGGKMEDAIQSE